MQQYYAIKNDIIAKQIILKDYYALKNYKYNPNWLQERIKQNNNIPKGLETFVLGEEK